MSKLYPTLAASESAPEVRKIGLPEKPASPKPRVSVGSRRVRTSGHQPRVLNLSRLSSSGSYGIDFDCDEEEISLEDPSDGIPESFQVGNGSMGSSSPLKWNWIRSELLVIPVVLAWTVLFGAVGDLIFTSAMFERPVVWLTVAIYPIFTILWCVWQAAASYKEGKALLIVTWLTITHVFISIAWAVIALLWQYWFSLAAAICAVVLQISYILLAMKRVSLSQPAGQKSFCF